MLVRRSFAQQHYPASHIYKLAWARGRAAVKGLKGFREMHFELKRLALEAIPMKQFFEGDFSPPGWESHAFCTNLTNAYFGALGPDLIIAQENLLTLRNRFLNGSIKQGLQSKACQLLHESQPWEWDKQLGKKALLLCDPFDFGPSGPDWNKFHKDILKVSSKMGPRRMMILIKSWLNSWTTISRMEHEPGDCIFCCGGGDALHHYLRCDHLWTLLVSCAHLDKTWLPATPAQRLSFC